MSRMCNFTPRKKETLQSMPPHLVASLQRGSVWITCHAHRIIHVHESLFILGNEDEMACTTHKDTYAFDGRLIVIGLHEGIFRISNCFQVTTSFGFYKKLPGAK